MLTQYLIGRRHRLLVAGALAVLSCRQSTSPCDDDTVPAIPLIRVIATDSAGTPIAARVSRIRADGTRSDTIPLERIGQLGTPPKGQASAMTVAIIANGYRERQVELGEVCFGTSQPLIVQMQQ
jgi:hypothetical protein